MKVLKVLGVLALSSISSAAFADLFGFDLKERDTVSYKSDYDSDSGFVNRNSCTITLRDSSGTEFFRKTLHQGREKISCGDTARNERKVYQVQVSGDALQCVLLQGQNPALQAASSHCGL
jgi:hypothetical protein